MKLLDALPSSDSVEFVDYDKYMSAKTQLIVALAGLEKELEKADEISIQDSKRDRP